MKLKFFLAAFAATAMNALANDEIVIANENETAEAITLTTPADEEFGFSTLSNNETLMAGQPADGHRLEEWSKAQKPTVKFGGYIIGKYAWDSREAENSSIQDGFNLRLVRLYVDGYLYRDFKYRLQLEVNGTPHVKDATLEWVHWKEFSIKAGQFKRAFTFEDPYNPFDVGVGDYSQLTKKMSGFDDRVNGTTKYEKTNNGGRDLGIQFQGDVLPIGKDKHNLIHYQVGVFNGQGINTWDVDKKKDFMGTIQFQPVKNLYIGAFGWKGSIAVRETQKVGGKDQTFLRSTERNRIDVGVKYESDWTVRAEYARSWGYKLDEKTFDSHDRIYKIKPEAAALGKQADAFYATVGVPCAKWLKAYVKYDAYRDYASMDYMNSIYSAAFNFKFTKNLYFQAQYNFVDNKKLENHTRYHQAWAQMYVRF